jgi:hypothetical protein
MSQPVELRLGMSCGLCQLNSIAFCILLNRADQVDKIFRQNTAIFFCHFFHFLFKNSYLLSLYIFLSGFCSILSKKYKL